MVVLESILAGVVAVIGALVLAAIGFIVWGWWTSQTSNDANIGAVAYDIRVLVFPVVIIVGLFFAAGFWWQYRRARLNQ